MVHFLWTACYAFTVQQLYAERYLCSGCHSARADVSVSACNQEQYLRLWEFRQIYNLDAVRDKDVEIKRSDVRVITRPTPTAAKTENHTLLTNAYLSTASRRIPFGFWVFWLRNLVVGTLFYLVNNVKYVVSTLGNILVRLMAMADLVTRV